MTVPVDVATALRYRRLLTGTSAKRRRVNVRIPKQLPPRAVQLAYQQALVLVATDVHELLRRTFHNTDRLHVFTRSSALERPIGSMRHDAAADDVARAAEQAREAVATIVSPTRVRTTTAEVAHRVSAHQREQFARQTRAVLGVDVLRTEPWGTGVVAGFVRDNTRLIRTMAENEISQVEGIVLAGVRQGLRPEQMQSSIRDRFEITDRHARLIARDQVNKLNGQINQLRQTSVGITRYVWRTVGDENVRDEHEERDGEYFDWDSPPEDGHPGEPIQCRCTAEPDFAPLLGIEES